MKKLFRNIIIVISFFVFLIVLSLGLLGFYTYDNEKMNYDKDKDYAGITNVIGDSMYNSFSNIASTNYEENEIDINISIDELNNYIYKIIKETVNENYLEEDDYIIQRSGIRIDSLFFEIYNGELMAKLRLTAYEFYKTTISLTASLSIDSNKILTIYFDDFKIGNYFTIKRDILLKLIKNIDFALDSGINFSELTLTIDFSELLDQAVGDQFLLSLIDNCSYNVGLTDDGISLIVDTTPIFNGGNDIINLEPISLDPSKSSITLNEEGFNSIIKSILIEKLEESYKMLNIGEKEFNIRFDGVYYDISTDIIHSNLCINDVKTSAKLIMTTEVDGNSLKFRLSSLYIGDANIVYLDDLFTEITIDSSMLGVSIQDITIDKVNEKITINY
ncbi:MAG: hypothetical protein IJA65_03025 [Acholeplasmatales bacterium]|nr:hypothetical protein [Acholeplasmatales bacterium]